MSSVTGAPQNTEWQSCIDACMRCAEACEFCATSDLKEQDVKLRENEQTMCCCLLDIRSADVDGQPVCKAIFQSVCIGL